MKVWTVVLYENPKLVVQLMHYVVCVHSHNYAAVFLIKSADRFFLQSQQVVSCKFVCDRLHVPTLEQFPAMVFTKKNNFYG